MGQILQKKKKIARNARVVAAYFNDDKITVMQEIFCRYYALHKEYRRNATLAYALAFDYQLEKLSDEQPCLEMQGNKCVKHAPSARQKAYNVCSVQASRLLNQPKIQRRVRGLLNEFLQDEFVDAEMADVILQDSELPSKVAAIREYNKLRKRTEPDGGPLLPTTNNYFVAFINAAKERVTPTPVEVHDVPMQVLPPEQPAKQPLPAAVEGVIKEVLA